MTSGKKITIVDYGMGNLGSIQNMLGKLGAETILTSIPEEIENSTKLILPGVGHFSRGMESLNTRGLLEVLTKKVIIDKVPVLGICLGMQLMGSHSEEGDSTGLGWVDIHFKKFDSGSSGAKIKVPCIGWNEVTIVKQSTLLDGMQNPRFYFVHSYYGECRNNDDTLLTATYENVYTAGFQHNNIYGVQFHPEKSHKFGMKLLKNYMELV
jgi:glutamine amidotransferase